jgi:ATP-dependent DNA ligase
VPGTFQKRFDYLRALLGKLPASSPLKLVETTWVHDEDELMLAFEDFLIQGFEGAIARNADGMYVNKRSYDLLKIKRFQDSEFKCIRVEDGVGKMAGHAVFVCETSKGVEFKAKMKGDHEALTKYFVHPELVVDKEVTVKYQGLTNKSGVPRFPVALRIREDV